MPELNVLIIGDKSSKALSSIIESKYLGRLFANFETENATDIRFNTFRELALKCKVLKIDIVFVEDEKMILQGIVDVLRKNFVNCIGLTAFWTNLVLSNKFARDMCQKYQINVPEKYSYPKSFPLIVKTDGFTRVANSIPELVSIRQEINNYSPEIIETVFLEKYIQGKNYILTSLFDGKTLVSIPLKEIPPDTIRAYNKKLENMLLKEQAGFIGYINSKIIFAGTHIYNIGFNLDFPVLDSDILFVFNAVIYQKLNELTYIKSS